MDIPENEHKKAFVLVTKKPPILNSSPGDDLYGKPAAVISSTKKSPILNSSFKDNLCGKPLDVVPVTKEPPILNSVSEDNGGGKPAADDVVDKSGARVGEK